MGKAHFMLFCDKPLVEMSTGLILEIDPRVTLVSSRIIEDQSINETTKLSHFRRNREGAYVTVILEDRSSNFGPYDGECWILIDGEKIGFVSYSKLFALEIVEVFLANGARSKPLGSQNKR